MELVQLGQCAAVEQFHNGRLHPGPAHRQDARSSLPEVRVERGDGVHLAGQVLEPDGCPHNDPQGALGTNKQPREVVAGDAFERLVAGVDEGPVGQHHIQGQHRVPGNAVLGAAKSPGIRGNVAADR